MIHFTKINCAFMFLDWRGWLQA